MQIIQTANYQELSHTAAILILNQLIEKPDSVLGLATGHTPSGLYRELVSSQQELGINAAGFQFFHLDEYLGMQPGQPESMAHYLCQHLLDPLGVPESQRHFVPADRPDTAQACQDYELEQARAGGIDLQILGIGSNGHIAFNEPGTPFDTQTHVIELSEATREANARYFRSGQTPSHAMTMGPRSILAARQILILAAGKAKAQAVRQMLCEPVSEDCPASILRYHPQVTLIIDREIATELDWPLPRFEPQPLEVFTRSQSLPRIKRALVAAPHPDDASIGCGGTLARLKAQGAELHFVSMSSGHRADMPNTTQAERIQLRMDEGQAEADVFAAEFTPLNLPFYEHHYLPGRIDVQTLVDLLRHYRPEIIFSTAPEDRHPAHRASALIVQEAIKEVSTADYQPELWCYEGPWYLFERDDFNSVVELNAQDLDYKLRGVQAHHSQVSRKRYDLASESLARFRAITVPESRLSSFGSGVQDLGEHIEIFQRLRLKN